MQQKNNNKHFSYLLVNRIYQNYSVRYVVKNPSHKHHFLENLLVYICGVEMRIAAINRGG